MISEQNSWRSLKTAYDDLSQETLWSFFCFLQRAGIGTLPPDKRCWAFDQVDVEDQYTEPGVHVFVLADTEEEAWEKLFAKTGDSSNPVCSCCSYRRWQQPVLTTIGHAIDSIAARFGINQNWYKQSAPLFRILR